MNTLWKYVEPHYFQWNNHYYQEMLYVYYDGNHNFLYNTEANENSLFCHLVHFCHDQSIEWNVAIQKRTTPILINWDILTQYWMEKKNRKLVFYCPWIQVNSGKYQKISLLHVVLDFYGFNFLLIRS